MGRRSRKRSPGRSPAPGAHERPGGGEAVARGARARSRGVPPRPRARLEERPRAPWAPVPLSELCILVGVLLLGVGFLGRGGSREALMAVGVALVAIGTLEFTVREHFAGYRSHTTLLSAVAGIAVTSGLYLANVVGPVAPLAIGFGVAALSWWALRGAFRRRAGGLSFRA